MSGGPAEPPASPTWVPRVPAGAPTAVAGG